MKINQLKQTLNKVFQSNKHIPLMIWSAPGIGKSSAVKQVAEDLGWDFIDLRLSLLNPVDLRGLPLVNKETHKAEWLSPDFLPNGKNKKQGILFLDEINLAPQSVMAAGYQLILDRKLGNYTLPEGWKIVAAGNRAEDQAAVTKFPAPLSNRFVHIDLDVDGDEWRKWAINKGVSEQIVAFLGKMPQHLFKMPKAGERSFPTPRSWENASKLHDLGLRIDSAIGEGVAAEFYAFIKVYEKLPDVDAILDGKEKRIPEELDVLWATMMSIVYKAQIAHIPNIFPYVAKMPKEFEVVTLTSLDDKSKDFSLALLASKEWSHWIGQNQEIINSYTE